MVLRSRVLLGACVLIKVVGRRPRLELQRCSLYQGQQGGVRDAIYLTGVPGMMYTTTAVVVGLMCSGIVPKSFDRLVSRGRLIRVVVGSCTPSCSRDACYERGIPFFGEKCFLNDGAP